MQNRVPSRRLALALLAVLATAGCPDDDDGIGFSGPEVFISPDAETTVTTVDLRANASAEHPLGEVATFSYSWTRDGADVEPADPMEPRTIDSDQTAKGQLWEVSVTASYTSGRVDGPATDRIRIVNSPPQTSFITFDPFELCPEDDSLTATIPTGDADGDPVSVFVQWFIDGELQKEETLPPGETDSTLQGPFFPESKGDPPLQINLEATPNDGQVDGDTARRGIEVEDPEDEEPDECMDPMQAQAATNSGLSISFFGGTSVVAIAEPDASGSDDASGDDAWLHRLEPTEPLSVGAFEVCSIRDDETLDCRGAEESAITEPPEGRFTQVAVAEDYACAVAAETGAIRCWGELPEESPLRVPPAGSFLRLGVGPDTACALRETGEVACWGDPESPLAEPPEGAFTHLDVRGTYACARTAEGAAHCWGP